MLDDQRLIKSALNDNASAFQLLVERYQDYVYSICFSIVKNKEDAEEAAQDAFVKVYTSLHKYASDSKFTTWLYTIAYRTAIDKYRSCRKRKQTVSVTDYNFVSDLAAGTIEMAEIHYYIKQAIDSLDKEESLIVRMFYMEELSIKEVSKIVDMTESNIKIKLFRSRKKLKDILERLLPDAAEQAASLYKS